VNPAAAFEVTLAVLVVTCPCALSLATPTALTAATSGLAAEGLLVSRSDVLESLAGADRMLLDKTGTLTRGRLSLNEVHPLGDMTPDRCLGVAAALERESEHPLANALAMADAPVADSVRVVRGFGIEGVVGSARYRIGNPEFVAELAGRRDSLPADDASVFLGGPGRWLAAFSFEDALKQGLVGAIDSLRGLGVGLEIASGDTRAPVEAVGERLGITRLRWRQTPEDKLGRIRELQQAGHRVIMVGDGINDAPVLAGADVSVAMGAGAPLAQTSADMILLGESLAPLSEGIRKARRTLGVIRQNITWAVIYNVTALPLAAAGLLAPWMAAIGMSLSSLLVVLNSTRLGGRRPERSERERLSRADRASTQGARS
jgi:Cu2+-exporting ATPase